MALSLRSLESTGSSDAGFRGTLSWSNGVSDLNPDKTTPMANVDVRLLDEADAILATGQTDSQGRYSFSVPHTGNARVEVVNLDAVGAGVLQGSNFGADGTATQTAIPGAWVDQDASLYHKTFGRTAYNTGTIEDFATNQMLMNIASYGRWINNSTGLGVEDDDPVTGLPERIDGTQGVRLFFSRSFTGPNNPVNGKPFAIRHNLPAAYSVEPSIVYSTVSPTRVETVAVNGNWWINILGPEGDLPDGWFIECIQTEDEAKYDDTSLPLAERRCQAEWLSEMGAAEPNHLRFMDATLTNNDIDTNDVDEASNLGNFHYNNRLPIEIAVAICNYLNCGLWWTVKSAATDALVQYQAEYVANNLKLNLEFIPETSNEAWNSQFFHARYYAALAIKRFGTQGQGTVTVVRGNSIITGTGTNFDEVFGPAPLRSVITIGEVTYQIDTSQPITATSMSTLNFSSRRPVESLTDTQYWVASDNDLWNDRGYYIRATQVAKIFNDHFVSVGQRYRLVNTMGGRQTSSKWNNDMFNAVEWQGEADFIDPRSVFDALAITGYFYCGIEISSSTVSIEGVNYPSGYAIRNKITDMVEEGGRQSEINTMLRGLFLDGTATVDGVTYRNSRPISFMAALFRNAAEIAHSHGMRLLCYEGTDHSLQSSVFGGSLPANVIPNVLAAWTAFMRTQESRDVYEAWAQAHVDHVDGPIMQYVFMSSWSQFGIWGSRPEYQYVPDSRVEVLDEYSTQEAWKPPLAA